MSLQNFIADDDADGVTGVNPTTVRQHLNDVELDPTAYPGDLLAVE